MALSVHLDDLKSQGIVLNSNLEDFISSLKKCKLPKGSFFSGTIYLKDLPGNLSQAEIQGVVGDIIGDMLIDMTLTSTDTITRWTCTHRTGLGTPKWIQRT